MRKIKFSSKPTCDGIMPLKGILKSGEARDDHQKVVCFSAPATEEHRDVRPEQAYPAGHPQFDEDPDFCKKQQEPVGKIAQYSILAI